MRADAMDDQRDHRPRDSLLTDAIVIAIALGSCYLVGTVLLAALRFLGVEPF